MPFRLKPFTPSKVPPKNMAFFKLLFVSMILQLATDLMPFDDWLYQRVALPDVNIYFRYAGTCPPVLLVHGYPKHSVNTPR